MLDNTTLREINPVFSGHETFPMRYGWLKKVYDACFSIEKMKKGAKTRDFFNSDEAIVALWVGKNMVSSMKHWAIYASLLDFDKNKDLVINDFARDIFKDDGHDPWLENLLPYGLYTGTWLQGNNKKIIYILTYGFLIA
jgi:hypothetical protein